jgi:hypothetical protein
VIPRYARDHRDFHLRVGRGRRDFGSGSQVGLGAWGIRRDRLEVRRCYGYHRFVKSLCNRFVGGLCYRFVGGRGGCGLRVRGLVTVVRLLGWC